MYQISDESQQLYTEHIYIMLVYQIGDHMIVHAGTVL